nr:glycosyltransferase family 2 protein [Asticcacaulis machinosus]
MREAGLAVNLTSAEPVRPEKVLVVVPCLNEAAHIGKVLDWLVRTEGEAGSLIVVADGGSTDGTQDIVRRFVDDGAPVRLLHNPKKIQSAGINLAVARYGDDAEYLIRIDAHGSYPEDFCEQLMFEARKVGCASIVVSMNTIGAGAFQKAVAIAQNSPLGNGGSKHRVVNKGEFVDHGHHALMRIKAFREVGGYDESFAHNEDAELDFRLRKIGYYIWMTPKTVMEYLPRTTARGLFKQYRGYGSGRIQNILKHKQTPGLRQIIPAMVLPSILMAPLAAIWWVCALPLIGWLCLWGGLAVIEGVRTRSVEGFMSGYAAMTMHIAWSVGFWKKWFELKFKAA